MKELRLHSSAPKLFKSPNLPLKRTSIPSEPFRSLFESDYCSYSTLNSRLFTQNSQKSPNTPKDVNLQNLKIKLINFLQNRKTEYFSESSPEKTHKKKLKNVKNSDFLKNEKKNSLSTNRIVINNDYLLGNFRGEVSKSFRKRKNIENLKGINSKLESTNASSNNNINNSKDTHGYVKKKDPKEEIYRFFSKKNKKDDDKSDFDNIDLKKLMKSMQSLGHSENSINHKNRTKNFKKKTFVKNDKKIESLENSGNFKLNKNTDNFQVIQMNEVMGRVKTLLNFYKSREKLYVKKIAILNQKVKDLENKLK